MFFLEDAARRIPDKLAYVMAGSEVRVSYADLNTRTAQGAGLFRSLGLCAGDCVVIYMENGPHFLEAALACIRAGLYFVPVGLHLRDSEVAFILGDCGARVCVTSRQAVAGCAGLDLPSLIGTCFLVDGDAPNFQSWTSRLADFSPGDLKESPLLGAPMVYTSGTTGQPKGIRTRITAASSALWRAPRAPTWRDERQLGHSESDTYLATGPLYHIAPFNWACLALKHGATVVVMEKFDAEWSLMLIEEHRVTHAQMVPTMLVRLLSLDGAERDTFDRSTLRHLELHSAPCAPAVKDDAIEWLGPIVYEIYGASEPAGSTFIDSHEWRDHRGSVGTPLFGRVHILDQAHQEVPTGVVGDVYFSGGRISFEYLNSPEKWGGQSTTDGWFSYGDIGYLDSEGYLYLTDRKSNMIIVGGVNVYPLEIESRIIEHPGVLDVAVVGVEDRIYGQQIHALVQLQSGAVPDAETKAKLLDHCRATLSPIKVPSVINFVESLPRGDNGKLLKRYLLAEAR